MDSFADECHTSFTRTFLGVVHNPLGGEAVRVQRGRWRHFLFITALGISGSADLGYVSPSPRRYQLHCVYRIWFIFRDVMGWKSRRRMSNVGKKPLQVSCVLACHMEFWLIKAHVAYQRWYSFAKIDFKNCCSVSLLDENAAVPCAAH